MQDGYAVYNRPGRLAPRLIQDILDGSLSDRRAEDAGDEDGSPLFMRCQELRQSLAHLTSSSAGEAHPNHDLLVIPSQTEENDATGTSLISCICSYCRYHFVFHVSPGHQLLGRSSQGAHLQHHYVRTKAERFEDLGVEESSTFKRYSLVARACYECSVCNHGVVIEATTPRLPTKWIDLVTDGQRIKDKIAAAKREDPERFQGVKEGLPTAALATLNAYLRNLLAASGAADRKRILFRNKIYYLQFGQDAEPLFRYLDFEYERNEDGEDTWVIPLLEPQAKTPLKSTRAFYEDVRSEIQSVVAKEEEMLQHTGLATDAFTSAGRVLDRVLECEDNKYRHSIGAHPSDAIEQFEVLGTTRDSDPSLLQWAYECQIRVDPSQQLAYLQALEGLFKSGTASRKTEAFETYVTTELSKQVSDSPVTPLGQAYRYFNLSPDCSEADSYILAVYKTFVEQSPAQKHRHRLMLQQIGSGRDSHDIMKAVYNEPMGIKEAYELLNADESYVMSGIALMAQQEINNPKTDLRLVLMALETIGKARPANDPSDTERIEFDQVVADIYGQLSGTDAQNDTQGRDLPIGLVNLRNTCYLNSILQYFFSVNAVRDLALRCASQPPLPSTQDDVRQVLQSLSMTGLQPGRAFLANHFARELGALFLELQTSQDISIAPKQRLANAALMRPFRLRLASEQATAANTAAKELPPLPPRSNPSPPYDETKVTVNAVADVSETSSDVSSQTLVNQADDERCYVVVDKTDGAAVDVEMSDGKTIEQPHEKDTSSDSHLTVEELAKELDQPNVGSDQMDIDEVMGNMIDLLEAAEDVCRAVNPASGFDHSIRQSFFSGNIGHRKNANGPWSTNKRSDRWAVAYPAANGPRDLYDALEPTFGLEQTDTDRLLYLTIEQPAPNFHVYIQRTSLVSKNLNRVLIPDTLYLDRYMDTSNESELYSRRKRAWNIGSRLMQIEEQLSTGAVKSAQPAVAPDFLLGSANVGGDADEDWNMVDLLEANDLCDAYGQPKTEITSVQPEHLASGPAMSGIESDLFADGPGPNLLEQRDRLLEERNALFDGMQKVKYRLQAVLCHIGTGRAGHYWAWVYDFEQAVWRKYNDTTVTVHNHEDVLQQLNSTENGEPYYLAYVQDSDIDHLVRIPPRGPMTVQRADASMSYPDVEMSEFRDMVSVERIEDVSMEPPAYPS